MELSQEAVLGFLAERGGRARNTELLEHFRGFLNSPEPQRRARARQGFKELVNAVATVRQEPGSGAKYVQLRKKYRQALEGASEGSNRRRRRSGGGGAEDAEAKGEGEGDAEAAAKETEGGGGGGRGGSARSWRKSGRGGGGGLVALLASSLRPQRPHGRLHSSAGRWPQGLPRARAGELPSAEAPRRRRGGLGQRLLGFRRGRRGERVFLLLLGGAGPFGARVDGAVRLGLRALGEPGGAAAGRAGAALQAGLRDGLQLPPLGRQTRAPRAAGPAGQLRPPPPPARRHQRPHQQRGLHRPPPGRSPRPPRGGDVEARDYSGRKAAHYLGPAAEELRSLVGAPPEEEEGDGDGEEDGSGGAPHRRQRLSKVLPSNLMAYRLSHLHLGGEDGGEPAKLSRKGSGGRAKPQSLQKVQFRTQIIHTTPSFRGEAKENGAAEEKALKGSSFKLRPKSNVFG